MKLAIIGAGPQGAVTADIVHSMRHSVFETSIVVDEDPTKQGARCGWHEVRPLPKDTATEQIRDTWCVAVAVGHNGKRRATADRLCKMGFCLAGPLIHGTATVSDHAEIGCGTVIGPGAIIEAGAVVGRNCIVNAGAFIGHDAEIEDDVNVCPYARIGGRTSIGSGAFIAFGAMVLPRKRIGAGSIVGAGALATHDVEPWVLAVGLPARPIEPITEAFDWGRLL